jgi:hypothetical protein
MTIIFPFITLILVGLTLIFWLQHAFSQKLKPALLLPLSFILGIAATTTFLLWQSLLTSSLLIIPIYALLLLIITFTLSRHRLHFINQLHPRFLFGSLSLWQIGLLVTFILFIGLTQLRHDYLYSDSLFQWFMRGKMFYLDNHINLDQLSNQQFVLAEDDWAGAFFRAKYPVLPSLLVTFHYLTLQTVDEQGAKIYWAAAFLALVWIITAWLKEIWPTKTPFAFLSSLLILTSPVLISTLTYHHFGSADIWLTLLNTLFVFSLFLLIKTKHSIYLAVAAVLALTAATIKIEGYLTPVLWLLFVGGTYRSLFIKELPRHAVPIILASLPVIGWQLLSSQIFEPVNHLTHIARFFTQPFSYLQTVVSAQIALIYELFNLNRYALLWPLILGISLLTFKHQNITRPYRWLYFLIIFALFLIPFSFAVTPLDLQSLVNASAHRLLLHWLPALYCLTNYFLYQRLKSHLS